MPDQAENPGTIRPTQDPPTVTPEGEPLIDPIQGLLVHELRSHEDERGDLVELFNFAWGVDDRPIVHVYQASVRPGRIKGWILHREQEDRLAILTGFLRWAFYDDRADSPTRGRLNVMTFSERRRALVVLPRGVWHAVQNVGTHDATYVNMPTAPYRYSDPDKYRLPVVNDLVPFSFDA